MTPQLKVQAPFNGVAAAAGATTTGIIDLLGYDWATIDVVGGPVALSTNVPTVSSLAESDVNTGPWVAIPAFATPATFAPSNTAAGTTNIQKMNVDCRGRKRFVQVSYSNPAAQTVSCIANLGRGEQAPFTAAKAGAQSLTEG